LGGEVNLVVGIDLEKAAAGLKCPGRVVDHVVEGDEMDGIRSEHT